MWVATLSGRSCSEVQSNLTYLIQHCNGFWHIYIEIPREFPINWSTSGQFEFGLKVKLKFDRLCRSPSFEEPLPHVYFIFSFYFNVLLLVQLLRQDFGSNRALCDKSTKFCTFVHWPLLNIFGNGTENQSPLEGVMGIFKMATIIPKYGISLLLR